MEDTPFRCILQSEFEQRAKKNSSYSLRSFAKALDISPSALSGMLNRKRPITDRMVQRLGLKLGYDPAQLEAFYQEAPGAHKVKQYDLLSADHFALICNWYHYAILELMATADFKSDFEWIARRLDITQQQVKIAIERLTRLGMVERDENSDLIDTSGGYTTHLHPGLSSQAARSYQKETLEKAIQAIETVAPQKRDHTSMTVAIAPEDLPAAREMTAKFRKELTQFLERENRKQATQVYQVNLALFPLTNSKENL